MWEMNVCMRTAQENYEMMGGMMKVHLCKTDKLAWSMQMTLRVVIVDTKSLVADRWGRP